MNKKKLSVVMAGAMLATTVAPIMAATTDTEVQASNLGLLIGKVRETLLSEKNIKFSNDKRNGAYAGQYIYYVKVDGKEVTAITDALNNGGNLQSALQTAIGGLTAGQTVSVCSRGYVQEGNNVYATTLKTEYADTDMSNATAEAITTAIGKNTTILGSAKAKSVEPESAGSSVPNTHSSDSASGEHVSPVPGADSHNTAAAATINPNIVVDPGKSITINLAEGTGIKGPIVIKPGDKILDFTTYINETGKTVSMSTNPITNIANFCGFGVMSQEGLKYTQDIPDEVINSYKIVGSSTNSFKTSDLFNGVMLTTEGHDLLSKLKEVNTTPAQTTNPNVKFATISGLSIGTADYTLPKASDGTYGFTMTTTDKFGNKNTYTIKGENKNDTQTLLSWFFTEKAKVDILAGENRYATAVEVAKEYADQNEPFKNGTGTIVMVNGNSLVDGLSASPLAAQAKAPMLLVEKDRIPKETADYIRTLAGDSKINDLSNITIDIVGGTGVVSRNVEKELKSYGFTVNRYGGRDREDTSMKVANVINGATNAYVVGAEGEADAMSIASVASNANLNNGKQAPIIVSKKEGLSDDTLEYLSNKKVAIVGGEAVVSKADFDSIKEAVNNTNPVTRIAGENRQETNAKVISTFYAKNGFGGAQTDVLVAKDGTRNKMDLVDALTVSNLAALNNAPIVLATNSLDKAQINALELYAKGANALYQVGHGVSLDVVKTLANLLGLEK